MKELESVRNRKNYFDLRLEALVEEFMKELGVSPNEFFLSTEIIENKASDSRPDLLRLRAFFKLEIE